MRAPVVTAIERGPHQPATSPDTLGNFAAEAKEKVASGQVCIVLRDDIKDNLPLELKILPIATIHTSKAFRSFLDLSFTALENWLHHAIHKGYTEEIGTTRGCGSKQTRALVHHLRIH